MVINRNLTRAKYLALNFLQIIRSGLLSLRGAKIGFGVLIGPGLCVTGIKQVSVGAKTKIGRYCRFNGIATPDSIDANLKVGARCYIGDFVRVNVAQEVHIGDSVMLSDHVFICDTSHSSGNRDVPIRDQGFDKAKSVKIGDGALIGFGSCILPGVTIGKNAVIGANSVVNKDVPDYGVASGVPAKLIRYSSE